MYNKVEEYTEKNGHIPKCNCGDKKMYNWIGSQKTNFKNNKLSEKYINLLEELNGWWWPKSN